MKVPKPRFKSLIRKKLSMILRRFAYLKEFPGKRIEVNCDQVPADTWGLISICFPPWPWLWVQVLTRMKYR
jgi:hypothetical protein